MLRSLKVMSSHSRLYLIHMVRYVISSNWHYIASANAAISKDLTKSEALNFWGAYKIWTFVLSKE